MKQKKSVEDYLKVIYVISKQKEVHGADRKVIQKWMAFTEWQSG